MASSTTSHWPRWCVLTGLSAVLLVVFRNITDAQVHTRTPLDLSPLEPPIVVVPVRCWDRVARQGLRFALNTSAALSANTIDEIMCLEP